MSDTRHSPDDDGLLAFEEEPSPDAGQPSAHRSWRRPGGDPDILAEFPDESAIPVVASPPAPAPACDEYPTESSLQMSSPTVSLRVPIERGRMWATAAVLVIGLLAAAWTAPWRGRTPVVPQQMASAAGPERQTQRVPQIAAHRARSTEPAIVASDPVNRTDPPPARVERPQVLETAAPPAEPSPEERIVPGPAPVTPIAPTTLDLPSAVPLITSGQSVDLSAIELPRAEPAPVAPERKGDESDELSEVRRTLRAYQEAYQRLDVTAAAEVWPGADRRALSRAFAALKSQVLAFRSCSIMVNAPRATARCRGTLRVVPKIGNETIRADQEWVFEMRRDRTEWKIDVVTTSAPSTFAASASTREPR